MRLQALVVLALAAAVTPADATEHTSAAEVRLGLQRGGADPWPSAGVYASTRLTRRWIAGGGYDFVRVFDASLRTSSDTSAGPVVIGSLRMALWRHFGGDQGWFVRTGATAGLAAPWLSVKATPDAQQTGTLLEAGLDLQAGWSWSHLHLVAFATPVWSFGTIRTAGSEGAGASWSDAEHISTLSLQIGLALGVSF